MIRFPFRTLCLFLTLVFSSLLYADKTDVVVLHNGDKITGEVKGLELGRLEFSTDSMGTVYIEWNDIDAIISTTGQSIELTDGRRFYGPLAKSEDANMVQVNTMLGPMEVRSTEVVSMYPVEAGFWDRLDISARIGFSWDKASSVGKYNIGLDTEYRDPRFITRANFTTEITTQREADDTARASASVLHNVFKPNKRFTSYFASVEQNDELGVSYRALAGAGYGWSPLRTNQQWFSLVAGLSVNRERSTEGAEEVNLEAVGVISYEYFKYSDPERRFTTNLRVFPSLTDAGRVRAEFNTDFRLEFLDDLFWVFDIFASYDSDPLDGEASTSDYGVTSSFSYKF